MPGRVRYPRRALRLWDWAPRDQLLRREDAYAWRRGCPAQGRAWRVSTKTIGV